MLHCFVTFTYKKNEKSRRTSGQLLQSVKQSRAPSPQPAYRRAFPQDPEGQLASRGLLKHHHFGCPILGQCSYRHKRDVSSTSYLDSSPQIAHPSCANVEPNPARLGWCQKFCFLNQLWGPCFSSPWVTLQVQRTVRTRFLKLIPHPN